MLAAVLGVSAAWALRRGNVRSGEATPWMTTVAWCGLSALWSIDPHRTLWQAGALGLAAAAVAAGGSVSPGRRLAGGALLAVALVEVAAGAWTRQDPARVAGWLVNPNHHATVLAAGALYAIALAVCEPRPASWLAAIASLILTAAAAASGSRALLLSLPAGLLGLLFARPAGFSHRRWIGAAAAVVLLLLAGGGLGRRLADQGGGKETMAWARADLWRAALRVTRTVPLGGVGLGTFRDAWPAVRPAAYARFDAEFVHSEPLQWLAETGVVGTGLLLWFLAAVWRARPGFRGGDSGETGLALAVAGIGAHALVDFTLHVPAIAALALWCFAAAWRPHRRATVRAADSPPEFRALAALVVAVSMACSALADRFCAQGAGYAGRGDVSAAASEFHVALMLDRWHPEALQAAAENGGNSPGSGARRAGTLRPRWVAAAGTEARGLIAAGDLPAAEASVARAERNDPFGFEPKLLRVEWLTAARRFPDAERALRDLARAHPVDLDVFLATARLDMARGRDGDARRRLRHVLSLYPHHVLASAWLAQLDRRGRR